MPSAGYAPAVDVYGHGVLGHVEAAEAVRGARLEGHGARRVGARARRLAARAHLEHLAQHAVARHQRAALAGRNTRHMALYNWHSPRPLVINLLDGTDH